MINHEKELGIELEDILAEIKKFELTEKILLVEDISDLTAKANSKLSMPEWQRIELDKHGKEFQDGTFEVNE